MHFITLVAVEVGDYPICKVADARINAEIAALSKIKADSIPDNVLVKCRLTELRSLTNSFARAVDSAVEYKLEPYCECTENEEYLEFMDETENLKQQYESGVLRYWKSLFINPRFVGKLTNKMQSELYSSVTEMKYYDFTLHNILELMTQLRDNTLKGIEDSLMTLFDTFSTKYSYIDETSKNIHYYNGWKTNKAHKVNKRVIIPLRGVWSNWKYSGKDHWSLSQYEAISTLRDLAKALDYIADPVYSNIDTHHNLENQIKINFDMGNASNIETKYFILTFYKKGTCHIVFKDDELLEKFNLYVGRQRDWLPPCYGRKAYKDLDEEERAVADSFSGGEEGYNEIFENPTKYLVDSSQMLLLTEGTSV